MTLSESKAQVKQQWAEESERYRQEELRIKSRLQNWRTGALLLGGALGISIVLVIPFLAGYPLHRFWNPIGSRILVVSMLLLCGFMYPAGTAYNPKSYLRAIRRANDRFGPPGGPEIER